MRSIDSVSTERSSYAFEKKMFQAKTFKKQIFAKNGEKDILVGTCRKRHFSHHQCSKVLKPPKNILALELVLRMSSYFCKIIRSCCKIAIRSKKGDVFKMAVLCNGTPIPSCIHSMGSILSPDEDPRCLPGKTSQEPREWM